MLEDVGKYVRLGLEALSSQASQSSEGVSDAVKSGAEAVATQLSTLAAGFLEWSAEARASLVQEIKDLVIRQVQEMGVATKKDLETLRARLDRLEGRLTAGGRPAGSATKASQSGRAGKSGAPRRAAAPRTTAASGKRTDPGRGRTARVPR
jgi:polyhydroxyalkanoate synthesis regulator phasin